MGTLAIINPRKASKSGSKGGKYFHRLKGETVSNAMNLGVLGGLAVGASIGINAATTVAVRKRLEGVTDPAERAKKAGNTALMFSGGAIAAALLLMPLAPVIGTAVGLAGVSGLVRQGIGAVDKDGKLASYELEAKVAQYRMDPEGDDADRFVPGTSRSSDMMADVNTQPEWSGQNQLVRVA